MRVPVRIRFSSYWMWCLAFCLASSLISCNSTDTHAAGCQQSTFISKSTDSVVPEPQYFGALFALGLYFFWLLAYLMKEDIKEQFNNKVKNLFLVLWCIVPGALLIGYTLYSLSTNWELNFQW